MNQENNISISDELKIRPLSEEDVRALQKRICEADPKKLNKIFSDFSNCINTVIRMLLSQIDKEDEDEIVELERVKRIINLAPLDERFLRSKDKLWAARNQIREKDASYFITKNYNGLIKKDSNQVMIETLIGIIRNKYELLSNEELELYWNILNKLVDIVQLYKILVQEPDNII